MSKNKLFYKNENQTEQLNKMFMILTGCFISP